MLIQAHYNYLTLSNLTISILYLHRHLPLEVVMSLLLLLLAPRLDTLLQSHQLLLLDMLEFGYKK